MILDVENRGYEVIISYFDENGKVKIKNYPIDQPENWKICGEKDGNRSEDYRNWDGKPVKKVADKFLNKWSLYEFIETLPEHERKEIQALNFPQVQSVDIETEIIDGFPEPELAKERITTIAIALENNSTLVLGWKPLDTQQQKEIYDKHREYLKEYGDWEFKYMCFEDEFNMLYTFVNKLLPKFSLVIGWNFMLFDWKYIYNRCNRIGIDVSEASPSNKLRGRDNIPLHIGMIDYMDIYKRYDRTIAIKESNKLDWVANTLLGVTKLHYDGSLQELYENDYDKYVLYNAIDAALVCLIHKKLRTTDSLFSLANMCNLSIYKSTSAVNMTEALLWKGYYEKGMVVGDQKLETPRGAYEGAYVKEPEPGIFRAATCFDYASLYPSIMRQYNISPEAFITKTNSMDQLEKYREDEKYIASVTGAIYDNTKPSVLKEILTDLYTQRKVYKNKHLGIEQLLAKIKN